MHIYNGMMEEWKKAVDEVTAQVIYAVVQLLVSIFSVFYFHFPNHLCDIVSVRSKVHAISPNFARIVHHFPHTSRWISSILTLNESNCFAFKAATAAVHLSHMFSNHFHEKLFTSNRWSENAIVVVGFINKNRKLYCICVDELTESIGYK